MDKNIKGNEEKNIMEEVSIMFFYCIFKFQSFAISPLGGIFIVKNIADFG